MHAVQAGYVLWKALIIFCCIDRCIIVAILLYRVLIEMEIFFFAGQEINRNILQKIKCQFASLQLKVRSAMEAQEAKMNDVHQFLVASFQGCCIPEASDFTKLFNIITQAKLWSYDHYVPLQELAEQFLPDDEQIRKHISTYRIQLSGFFATTKIIDFVNLSELEELEDDSQQPFAPEKYKKHYRKLKIKLKLKNITELTLSYVNTLWQSFAEEFGLPSLTAVIDKIIDGSLVISWLILPHIADKILASNSKALRFYQRHDIVKVWIDDELLYYKDWIVSVCLCTERERDRGRDLHSAYCIAGKFGGELNLAVWWSAFATAKLKSANIFYSHTYVW